MIAWWLACNEGVLERLPPVDQANRVAVSLLGRRPTVAEITTITEDPGALEALVDTWLQDPAFLDTVKDQHAEIYALRSDVLEPLPAVGPLFGNDLMDMSAALSESPLELVAWVVAENRPYTELVTTPTVMTNAVHAEVYGLPFDPEGPTWQTSTWVDGRPSAGLLSDAELWRRYESAGSNFHRLRAAIVADRLLCHDLAATEVELPTSDLVDEEAVAEAVTTDPACVACHQVLDPLAAVFWGYKNQIKRFGVVKAFQESCRDFTNGEPAYQSYTPAQYCYPLEQYTPADEGAWATWGLPPPAYFGAPVADLAAVGRAIADDPRFARCTARQIAAWYHQVPREDVADDLVDTYTDAFVASGHDFRALTKAIVLDDAFLGLRGPGAVGVLDVRPEQLATLYEDLVGFTWVGIGDLAECEFPIVDGEGTRCFGPVDLLRSARYGFRAMAGGIDAVTRLTPVHGPTPLKELTLKRLAEEAAATTVYVDLAAPPSERHLLHLVGPTTVDEATVRVQLAALHERILAEPVDPWGPEVTADWGLWKGLFDATGSVQEAWQTVLTVLFRDARMTFL